MPYVVLKPTNPNNEYKHPQQQYITGSPCRTCSDNPGRME